MGASLSLFVIVHLSRSEGHSAGSNISYAYNLSNGHDCTCVLCNNIFILICMSVTLLNTYNVLMLESCVNMLHQSDYVYLCRIKAFVLHDRTVCPDNIDMSSSQYIEHI